MRMQVSGIWLSLHWEEAGAYLSGTTAMAGDPEISLRVSWTIRLDI